MIKTTMAALLLTTTGALALDNQNNVGLYYSDNGAALIESLEGNSPDTNDDQTFVQLDGRQGIIEYSATLNNKDERDFNVGVAIPVGANFGVVGGVTENDEYVGAVYDTAKFELRYTYELDNESNNVSGRYHVNDRWSVNAGVAFDDRVGEDETYTTGVSLRF